MTDSDRRLALADLVVPRADVPWSHLPGAQNHRPITRQELVEVALSEGGEVVEVRQSAGLNLLLADLTPGRYLVYGPLESEE